MTKQYFQHDYHASSDIKCAALIKRYGASGYGIYWFVNELLHQAEDSKLDVSDASLILLADTLNVKLKTLKDTVHYCISVGSYKKEQDHIFSCRVLKNKDKRAAITEARKRAGSEGGKQKVANCSKGVANAKQNVANAKQNVAKRSKLNKTKLNEIKRTNDKSFVVPTIDEVHEYFTEKQASIWDEKDIAWQADKFHSRNTSLGWMVGKNSMKDWKAAVRTWIGNNYDGIKEITQAKRELSDKDQW